MSDDDEARILRARVEELARRLERLDTSPLVLRTPLLVGEVFQVASLPNLPGRFYATHPCTVQVGAEGGAGTVTPDAGKTVYMDDLGPRAAQLGDRLIGHAVPFRWVAERGGPPVETPCGQVCVNVSCGPFPVPGATVTLKKGTAVVGTCTTDAGGHCCIHYFSAGTNYHYEVTPPAVAGWGPSVVGGNFTVTCSTTTPPTFTFNVALTPATGYSCTRDGCCPDTRTTVPFAPLPYPTSMILNDGKGNIGLSQIAYGVWRGVATRHSLEVLDCSNPATGPVLVAGDVELRFTLACGSALAGGWTVDIDWQGCRSSGTCFGPTTPPYMTLNPDPTCGATNHYSLGVCGFPIGFPTTCPPNAITLSETVNLSYIIPFPFAPCHPLYYVLSKIYGPAVPCFGAGSFCFSIPFTATS